MLVIILIIFLNTVIIGWGITRSAGHQSLSTSFSQSCSMTRACMIVTNGLPTLITGSDGSGYWTRLPSREHPWICRVRWSHMEISGSHQAAKHRSSWSVEAGIGQENTFLEVPETSGRCWWQSTSTKQPHCAESPRVTHELVCTGNLFLPFYSQEPMII